MKVHLASAWGGGLAFDELTKAAGADRFKVHALTSDPDEADLVLFAENVHFEDLEWNAVLEHPIVQRHREKTFLYNESDQPWCVMPGLYCSMPRRSFQPRRQKACSYLYTLNELLSGPAPDARRWLYSFLGAANHPSRRRIFKLQDTRALLEDTSRFNMWKLPTPEEKERRQRRYATVMHDSMFGLCPRGVGTSSYRLYETMMSCVAPVVISDEWVEPEGPDWDGFLIRVAEDDIADIPSIVREHESEAIERGVRARKAWEQYFAREVRFHRAIEQCRQLLELRVMPESVARFIPSIEHQRSRVRRWLRVGKELVLDRRP